MTLVLAVGAAVLSAIAYGAGTAGQHAAAYRGEADVAGLRALVRDPRWLLATLGDLLGVALQIVALSYGPLALVQPVLILSLPVAILLRPAFGGPGLDRRDLVWCGVLALALAAFFGLLGDPGRGGALSARAAVLCAGIALAAGAVVLLAVRRIDPVPRALAFGAVAGCWFGVVGVMVATISAVVRLDGWTGLGRPAGLAPVIGVVVLAAVAYLLVQVGFQLGPIGASLPANLVLDPLTAVVLGAAALHETVPLDPGRIVGYVLVLGAVSICTALLAREDPPVPVAVG